MRASVPARSVDEEMICASRRPLAAFSLRLPNEVARSSSLRASTPFRLYMLREDPREQEAEESEKYALV